MNLNNLTLWEDVSSINGVGTKTATTLKKLHIDTKIDLLLHFPISITKITYKNLLKEVILNEITSIELLIKSYINKQKVFLIKKKQPFQILAEDKEKSKVLINFFNYYNLAYIKSKLPLNSTRIITGKFEKFHNQIIVNHPEITLPLKSYNKKITIVRNYKTTSGITSKHIGNLINIVLKDTYTLPEWLNSDFVKKLQLPTFIEALQNIHIKHTSSNNKDILRLSLDEMLAFQLKLLLAKKNIISNIGYPFKDSKGLVKILYHNLPFQLTQNQIGVLKEIFKDLKNNKPMVRLLEGDVGSGKTIVAILCCTLAVSSGYSAAIMAPTESLAKQHFDTFNKFAKLLNLNIDLLVGSTTIKKRKNLLLKIQNNEIDILISTHAILQSSVKFNNLGLIIIDEQHKFGVAQRINLVNKNIVNKNKNPHILMLSATPIPRTLALTNYGQIKISRLLEKPNNRKPIITKAIPSNKISKIIQKIKLQVSENKKIFWICPLIVENEQLEYTSASKRYNNLLQYLTKDEIWLLHGKMKSKERDKILLNFRNANKGILVSTTVIEVGIDIPDANIIVIEHAERFGLAQLHQLRGRVGRGNEEAYCLLIYDSKSGIISKQRMQIMEKSHNGFYIAEKDYELRGAGNILGTKQSGESPFKIATQELQNQYFKSLENYAKYLYEKQPQKFEEYYNLLNKIFHFNIKDFNFIDAFNKG